MAYQCSLDGFMLQMVVSYDGLHYFYDYQYYRPYFYYYLGMDRPFNVSFDGHMEYAYSFPNDLDIPSPLVHLVFSSGHG